MIKKFHLYLIILTLGLLLLPSLSYACGTQSEKECCKKETTAKQEHKECSEESHATNPSDNCNGKCGHANCTTTSVNVNLAVFNEFDFTYTHFDFLNEKQNFYTTITFISSGFSSLWLIPKIS
ncbi:hypothetical protein RCH18_001260 [Flavobacterium sp. PL11]|uniref:hypothetical protein n=1 Tax=Flavobacterium sp. PL11 TaxID=3071717 RepID=UPI002E05A35E|nr:hypothetical protein [Flavobacterium sp. PL11]